MDGRHLRRRRRLGEAKTLYLPKDIIEHIDELADEKAISFSKLTAKALRAHYGIKVRKPKRRIIRRTFARGDTAKSA